MDAYTSSLLSCYDDYTGLWVFIRTVEQEHKDIDELEAQNKTLELIEYMLNQNLIRAGMFDGKGGFEYWNLPNKEIIARIRSEWNALGRKPNIADIVWFDTTEKGNREAETLLQNLR